MKLASSPSQFLYLAQKRREEATALLKTRHFAGAMYLAGYIVECALKAVLAKYHNGTLPGVYQHHDLVNLRGTVVGLKDPRGGKHVLNDADASILQGTPQWSHLLRYDCEVARADAVVLFLDRAREVLTCLLKYT